MRKNTKCCDSWIKEIEKLGYWGQVPHIDLVMGKIEKTMWCLPEDWKQQLKQKARFSNLMSIISISLSSILIILSMILLAIGILTSVYQLHINIPFLGSLAVVLTGVAFLSFAIYNIYETLRARQMILTRRDAVED